jgi:hypothetical protein
LIVERWYLPRKTYFGLFVLFGSVANRSRASYCTNRFVASANVGFATLVIRVSDVLTNIFPGEKGAETSNLG